MILSTCSSGASGSLVGIGARNGSNLEGVHGNAWIVDLELAVARVDDIDDAVNSQRGLCNIGRNNALALPALSSLEDLGLW